jgi:predicted ATPase
VLQTAAVIGMQMTLPLLQAVADVSEDELHLHLGHLQRPEFLYEAGGFPALTYAFKHALTREVAYQSLLRRTRQQVHQRIAQVLAAQFSELVETQPELLAPIYGWFTEGFDTADLQEAKALLDV